MDRPPQRAERAPAQGPVAARPEGAPLCRPARRPQRRLWRRAQDVLPPVLCQGRRPGRADRVSYLRGRASHDGDSRESDGERGPAGVGGCGVMCRRRFRLRGGRQNCLPHTYAGQPIRAQDVLPQVLCQGRRPGRTDLVSYLRERASHDGVRPCGRSRCRRRCRSR